MFYRFPFYLCVLLLTMACQETSTATKTSTQSTQEIQPKASVSLESLAIEVSAEDNRPVSFTNKRSGYYYTQTHKNDHPEHSWFAGYNLAQKRLFNDYQIKLDGKLLSRSSAKVLVFPDKLVRHYDAGVSEQLALFDNQDIVRISLTAPSSTVTVNLIGEQIQWQGNQGELSIYKSAEDPGKVIATASIEPPSAPKSDEKGFYILIADNVEAINELLNQVRENDRLWQQQRQQRMIDLISNKTYLQSSDQRLTKAIQWQTLNLDSLMTNQHGKGIYAGLPWFNEYWGRDSFISLPGATLVTGQFDFARDMITAFAKFQDRDPNSKFFGRVPNRVRIEDIDYHTTDGTPRFIIEMQHYVQYSGDTSLIAQLYPNVKDAINGSLQNWVDESGYLLHADNETWMDARREPDKVPYSPRGTRANDIQALWFEQLNAGIYFAEVVNDVDAQQQWQQARDKLQTNFTRDFILKDEGYLADHLNQDGSADTQLRPNQLYAFDLIQDKSFIAQATKTSWQQLVYPWGVASLDNRDKDFHPYHLTKAYHKDAAYHNGTVWLWNNGIAMQRMIEAGAVDNAYQLFANMNAQALDRGVVGGLAENADAYPHPGKKLPTITGTYLQAWSNAEQLRVWYQYFLGIRPDLIKNQLTFAPRLPAAIEDLHFQVQVGKGQISASYSNNGSDTVYQLTGKTFSGDLIIDLPSFPVTKIAIDSSLQVTIKQSDTLMTITHVSDEGSRNEIQLQADANRLSQMQRQHQIMADVKFAMPLPISSHKVLLKP